MFIRLSNPHSRLKKRVFLVTLVLFTWLQLSMPMGALAASADVVNETTESWYGSTSWDGGWGAFNASDNETLGGTCGLEEKQAKALGRLMDHLQADVSSIKAKESDKAKRVDLFKDAYTDRLKGGKGATDDTFAQSDDLGTINPLTNRINVTKNPLLHPDRAVLDTSSIDVALDNIASQVNSSKMSRGCDSVTGGFLDNIQNLIIPDIITIFKSPGVFMMRVFSLPFSIPALIMWKLFSPYAIAVTVQTPHVERGDTWLDANPLSIIYKGGATEGQATCSQEASGGKDKDVGFNCDNVGNGTEAGNAAAVKKQEENTWIKMAKSLRNILSAVYSIIVIVVALLYMYNRNEQNQYNIKVILPRVFFAVFISASAPFIMGMMVTGANWIVQGIMAGIPGNITQYLNQVIMGIGQTGFSFGGIVGGIVASVFPILLLIVFSIAFTILYAASVARFLAMVLLVILTPIACLGFVIPKFQHVFGYWARGWAACCAFSVIEAFILVAGMEVSTAIFDAERQADQFMLASRGAAAMVLIVTAIMMIKVIKHIRGYATGNSTSILRRATGTAVKVGSTGAAIGAAATGNPMAAQAAWTVGRGVGEGLQRPKRKSGGMIPQQTGANPFAKPTERQPNTEQSVFGQALDRQFSQHMHREMMGQQMRERDRLTPDEEQKLQPGERLQNFMGINKEENKATARDRTIRDFKSSQELVDNLDLSTEEGRAIAISALDPQTAPLKLSGENAEEGRRAYTDLYNAVRTGVVDGADAAQAIKVMAEVQDSSMQVKRAEQLYTKTSAPGGDPQAMQMAARTMNAVKNDQQSTVNQMISHAERATTPPAAAPNFGGGSGSGGSGSSSGAGAGPDASTTPHADPVTETFEHTMPGGGGRSSEPAPEPGPSERTRRAAGTAEKFSEGQHADANDFRTPDPR